MLNIVNLYRNIFFVIDFIDEKNEFIIFYEFFTNYFFNYNFFKRIDQRDEYQIMKFLTSYKKFVDYQALDIFVNYKNEYIYRMIIEKNEIKRIFNVEWQNNKRSYENLNHNDRSITKFLQFSSIIEITFAISFAFVKNNIDQFLNEFDLNKLTNNIKQ